MTCSTSRTEYAVTLWVRETGSYRWNAEPSIDERLIALRNSGVIDDLVHRVWGGHIPCEDGEETYRTPTDVSVRERVRTFQTWADSRGYSLAPGFRKRERTSTITDRTESIIVPPIVCLAVYDEGTLVGVYPCSNSERTITVGDCLETFETDGTPPLYEPIAADSIDLDDSDPLLPDTPIG